MKIPHIEGALSRPLGQPSLDRFVEPGDRVVVVMAPPPPGDEVATALPAILAAASRAGASSIGIRLANGVGPRVDAATLQRLSSLGVPVGDRSCDDPSAHLPLGWTSRGVARVDRHLVLADRLILLGSWDGSPSAGAQLIVPGCADRATASAAEGAEDLLEPEILSLAPPTFLVAFSFQQGSASLFAGDVEALKRAARTRG